MDRSHRLQAVQALNPAPWFWHLKMEGAPLDQFYGSSRGKVFPRRLLRAPPPFLLGRYPQAPHFQPRQDGSRLRSPFVPRELQLLNRHWPPRTPAVPEPTNPPVLRILGFVGSATGAFSRRTGLDGPVCCKGRRPSRCQGHPSFALLQPGIPPLTAHTPDSPSGKVSFVE
jgi:hypothetical protein